MKRTRILLVFLASLFTACAYRPYAGDLYPLAEEQQPEGTTVADDGTVTFTKGRLEVRLRPMTDGELNRQFSAYSQSGARSTNPFTFANSTFYRTGETPRRFTVFRLTVKNYEYPKVWQTGDVVIESQNGRKYYHLFFKQLENYYQTYILGYRGNEYSEWGNRKSLLKRTMFPSEPIFSGQEQEGFVIFEPLADDVSDIEVKVEDLVIRFDFRGEPVESIDIPFHFKREIGRIYPE